MHDCRVLVVEDDRDLREVISDILEGEGFPVTRAANGHEALERLRGGYQPDVILTNLLMPVIDGYELRAELKRHAGWASIPLIVLTASKAPQASLSGFEAVLRKPVDLEVLVSKVRAQCVARARRGR